MGFDVEAWILAGERTRQLNRYHSIQIDLIKYDFDLYTIENIHTHYSFIKDLIKHKKPNIKLGYKTMFHDLENHKYCFPIREVNYESGKHSICSLVDEAKFFAFEDKELALSLIFESDAYNLKSIGYLKWDEHKLIDFMSKRLIKKTKLKL